MAVVILIIAYLILLGLALLFNRGAHCKRTPSELHARDRYQVLEDIENENQIFMYNQ